METNENSGMTTLLVGMVVAGAVILGACLFVYDLQVTTQATGIVEARETSTLYAPKDGRVAGIFVRAGDWVEAGRPVLQLEDSGLRMRILDVEQAISRQVYQVEEAELKLRELAITGGVPGIYQAKASQDLREDIEAAYLEISEIYQGASEGGGVSKLKALEKTIDAMRARINGFGQDAILYKSAAGLPELYEEREHSRIRNAQFQIDSLSNKLALMREDLASLQIIAPISGRVTDVYPKHLYASVKGGEALLSIADPSGGFEVEALISDRNVDLVTEGMEVRLESHVYQSSTEGYMRGRITQIVRDAYYAEVDSDAQFAIEVAIESYPVEPVIGSKVDLEIVLSDMSPVDLLVRRSVRAGATVATND